MIRSLTVLGAALAMAAPAYAFPPAGTPITTGLNISGNGTAASAIFAYQDAGDQSLLNLLVPLFAGNPIFNNQTASLGDTVSVGSPSGLVTFELLDTTTSTSFLNNVADVDGNYHFFATSNFADFGVGALDPAVVAAIAALPAGTNYRFVGAEDRAAGQGSDFDYNDIIYVFTQLSVTSVPEASSIALFGLGLLGLGLARRRA